jgi:mono/diheme cytochrome c family protein/glucose/arabinose dehydrogenase
MKSSLLFFLSAFAAILPVQAQLSLQKGDHIAIVGSGLADRQQHHGWLESLIHKAYPDLELTVRNLGFTADEVNVHPRSDEVPTTEYFLNMKPGTLATKVGNTDVVYTSGADFHANVILAYWGFNESFKGEAGLADFKKALDESLKKHLSADYGKGQPRVVLLSPIAHENLKDPANFPDGSANNKNLALYTAAMAEVAKANSVPFVDLFAASQAVYGHAAKPLTINGIFLSDEGDKALAPVQFKALFGKEAPSTDDPYIAKIREAVLEKNVQWHHRYRTVDQYNIFGQRSRIKYADAITKTNGVDNATILGQELAQRDVKTANRDKAVWAAAQGKTVEVKDDNLPPVLAVAPNRPEPVPYLDGAEAVKFIKVPEGAKAEFVASEKEFPDLINPVQMNFDTRGRLWVAVWPNYPETTPTTKVFDKLLVFDIDPQTGKFTKCTTFLDGLNCPTGFQLYKDGVLVMQSPDMWFVRDTDGDGKGDWKERIVHGLDAADSHHETNSICYEPGGAVYFSDGVFHRTNVETLKGPVRNVNGAIYRYEPRSNRFDRYVPYGFANPHGRVFDYWGNDIITDATGNANYFAPAFSGHLDSGSHPRMKEFWNRPSRPCPGTAILSSRHFPDDWQGNFLNTNVIGFQGIFRAKVSEEGSGIKGETIEALVEGDIQGNPNFRPSGVAAAPDGSLYFMDWSQMLIGHLQHHLRDPNRGHEHGRIYRITYPSRPLLKPKKIHGESIANLVELLKEPEDNVRLRAKIELDTHDSKEVIAAVQKWEAALDKGDKNYEHHRLEALWVHQWHNVVNLDLLNAVLKSPEPRARAQAVRVTNYWSDRVPNTLAILEAAIKDSAPRVRLEAVRALSFIKGSDVPKAIDLAKLVMLEKDYYIDYCFRETMKQLATLPEGKDIIGKDPLLAARLRATPDASFGPTDKKLSAADKKLYDLGKEVFNREAHCVTCHQADGKGVDNIYPGLAKSNWLEGDGDRVIKIVLKGLYGPLDFQGKKYGPEKNTPPMMGFGPLLKDEELAAVISYVHQSFGNNLPMVKVEDVKRVRESTKDRAIFYMVDEILKEHPLEKK